MTTDACHVVSVRLSNDTLIIHPDKLVGKICKLTNILDRVRANNTFQHPYNDVLEIRDLQKLIFSMIFVSLFGKSVCTAQGVSTGNGHSEA